MSWKIAQLKRIPKHIWKRTGVNTEALWKCLFASTRYSALSAGCPASLLADGCTGQSRATAMERLLHVHGLQSHRDFHPTKAWHSSVRMLLTILLPCVCTVSLHLWSPREELLAPCIHQRNNSRVISLCSVYQRFAVHRYRSLSGDPDLTSFTAYFFASLVAGVNAHK